jgi:hypothetical protein
MSVMSCCCWLPTQVPPEYSVTYWFTPGNWLCTVVICDGLPP